jgi:hypothetical protein
MRKTALLTEDGSAVAPNALAELRCVNLISRLSRSFALSNLRASRLDAHGVHDFVLVSANDLRFQMRSHPSDRWRALYRTLTVRKVG